MKESYGKNIQLKCIACGDTEFEFNDDQSWVKCQRCGKEYSGGKDELIELNQSNIGDGIENMKSEVIEDLKKELSESLKNSFKGNNYIKFK